MPSTADTTIDLLATERGCTNSRGMGDALRGPQVIEIDGAVLVAFAVIPVGGFATCPGIPSTPASIELSDPLGQRGRDDGLFFPPTALVAIAGH